MSAHAMYPLDPALILKAMLSDRETGPIPGCIASLRFPPSADRPFRLKRYGRTLETPLGAAAGPHTQLCQNIVTAWQAGARFLELKTVQALDEIRIPRPCIDMRDEGYNCEWSQELRLEQSYREYLHAYVLIHVLRHAWGYPALGDGPGFVFNMSAGYDLEGIKSPPMQAFFDKMADARRDIEELRWRLAPVYPAVCDIPMHSCLSDNLTVSTMHGCPPGEIERIGRYFLEERGLHTTIKLNPTLLGPDALRGLLAGLGYDREVPEEIFENDLKYDDAVGLITTLRETGTRVNREFHVKLTNTLPTRNKGTALPASEDWAYMSGRALHPLAVALGARLQECFRGSLEMSFSAGITAENAADSLACGLWPLTVCSDLLRPGGYIRMHAMLRDIEQSMRRAGASSLQDFTRIVAGQDDPDKARLRNITVYAAKCAQPDGPYARLARQPARSFERGLPVFDCSVASCSANCPLDQRHPAYLGFYAAGEGRAARLSLMMGNPLHHMQAAYCDGLCGHKCEKYCFRNHVDTPVRIQAVRSLVQSEAPPAAAMLTDGRAVLVRGDGIAGLVCAFWLNRAGMPVLVESSSGEQRAERAETLGKALWEGIEEDRKALAHRGVEFSARPVDLPDPLPDGIAVYTSADAVGYAGKSAGDADPSAGPLLITGNAATGKPASIRAAVREGSATARHILKACGLSVSVPPARDKLAAFRRRKNGTTSRGPLSIFTAAQARSEASRCLQCDLTCGVCVNVCPNRANFLAFSPLQGIAVPYLRRADGGVRISEEGELRCEEAAQVLHLADLCNQCGNCATFCPSSEAPFQVKFPVFLSAEAFAAHERGVLLQGPESLLFKEGPASSSLIRHGARLVFDNDEARLEIEPSSLHVVEADLKPGRDEARLDAAALAMLVWQLTHELRSLLDQPV